MAASKCASLTSQAHLSLPPAVPMTRQPLILAIWPATEPVAPAAPDTTTVSPALILPISIIPKYDLRPLTPNRPSARLGGVSGATLLHPAEAFAIGHEVVLPAQVASHEVARLEVRMARFDHLPDSKGLHDIAKRNRRLVGVARNPDALRGVDRQPQGSDQDLPIGGPWHRCLIP